MDIISENGLKTLWNRELVHPLIASFDQILLQAVMNDLISKKRNVLEERAISKPYRSIRKKFVDR